MRATSLPGRILELLADPWWAGAIHRDQLADLTGRRQSAREFKSALMMLYQTKRIDFCGQYVVLRPRTAK